MWEAGQRMDALPFLSNGLRLLTSLRSSPSWDYSNYLVGILTFAKYATLADPTFGLRL